MALNDKTAHAEYLGTGLAFPPTLEKLAHGKADIKLVSGAIDIEQSLHILLSTRPGERVLETEYGCNLDKLLFEPLTVSLIALMRDTVKMAIIRYEPRVVVNDVSIRSDERIEEKIWISIDYTIRSNNSRFNFVYPFYQQEGTDVVR